MFENIFVLHVSLTFWIISQILGVIGLALAMWSFQVKSKIKFLLIIGSANIFITISSAFLLNWVVFAINAIASVRSFVFLYLEKRKQAEKSVPQYIPFIFMILFMIAVIVSVTFTWIWWFDFLLMGASLVIIYGNWAKGTHIMRLGCLALDTLAIVNYIVFSNLIGLLQSVLLISSVIIFYVRFFLQNEQEYDAFLKNCPEEYGYTDTYEGKNDLPTK